MLYGGVAQGGGVPIHEKTPNPPNQKFFWACALSGSCATLPPMTPTNENETTNQETGFCPTCDVSLDLHDGPDTCRYAEMKADLLGRFDMMFGGR